MAIFGHHEQPVKLVDYKKFLSWEVVTTLQRMKEIFSGKKIFAFDTETTGLNPEEHKVAGFSWAFDTKVGYYVPLLHKLDDNAPRECLDFMYDMIKDAQMCFMHNKKFDLNMMQIAEGYGVEPMLNVYDTQAWNWLRDTTAKSTGLKAMSEHFLGIVQPSFADTAGDKTFDYARVEQAAEYAALDAICTFGLAQDVDKKHPDLKSIFKIDNLSIEAIRLFEIPKVPLDAEFFKIEARKASEYINELEREAHRLAGYSFNLNSPKQKAEALLKSGCVLTEKTKSGKGWKTDQDTLAKLDHPLAALIAKHGTESTYYGTFVKKLAELAEKEGGARFNYKCQGTVTGRFASGGDTKNAFYANINAQNMPKPKQALVAMVRDESFITGWRIHEYQPNFGDDWAKAEQWRQDLADKFGEIWICETGHPDHSVRSGYIPDGKDDSVFVSIDYSGQELRIASNFSNEKIWVNTFLSGGDLHTETAKAIWGEHADKNHRKKAKSANFGLLYGGNDYTLQGSLSLSPKEAKEFYDSYNSALPTLAKWKNYIKKKAKKEGTVRTAFGRPFRMAQFFKRGASWGQLAYGERVSLNWPVQGTGGDIIRIVIGKLLMLRIKNPQFNKLWRFVNTVHDEVNYSVKKKFLTKFMQTIPGLMRMHPKGWAVPLEVECSIGPDWGTATPYNFEMRDDKPVYTPIGDQYLKKEA